MSGYVGDWVIMDSDMLCLEYYDDYKEGWIATKLYKATENMAYGRQYRPATVLDYLRTLSAEQMAILQSKDKCDLCVCGYKNTGKPCDNDFTCQNCIDKKAEWLNQPLTDELVEWLGGK